MAKKLVIVESPAKAKTIGKYLGKDFSVKASIGHIKDLPVKTLGVDLDHQFEPSYEVIKGKEKVIGEIRRAAANSEAVYLATDPDREGEAIAWHIAEEILQETKPKRVRKKKVAEDSSPDSALNEAPAAFRGPIHRVLFNEITKSAVAEAIAHPQKLNSHLFDAQQARRVLDRLVGYQISPLLWDKVRRGLSAGRVQSVAVRMICEREAEIEAFKTTEYWTIQVQFEGARQPLFWARLIAQNGKKIEISNQDQAHFLRQALEQSSSVLQKITRKERKRYPAPPFITSTLQQEASRKLGFTAKRTMRIAQDLYEGIEVEGGDPVGLITYMRTDSTRLSPDALTQVRRYIEQSYSKAHLPAQPIYYRSKKGAQDAHEAIRPTSLQYTPERVAPFLSAEQQKLYELIWNRFVACQMEVAVYDQTSFDIVATPAKRDSIQTLDLRATGSVLKFSGFMAVYIEGQDEVATSASSPSSEENEEGLLPTLSEGESLKRHQVLPEQHFTEPPPRYTEASLVKELEEKGIGRPSTYATILSTITEKEYVNKDKNRFFPTSLGKIVNNLLVQHFPDLLNTSFTAQMEGELDEVEEGKLSWKESLAKFYQTFEPTLKNAKLQMKNVKRQEVQTDFTCEKCGAVMVVKWGRHGEFLACGAYPDCKNTKEIQKSAEGAYQIADVKKEEPTGETCEKCQSPMVLKRGRFGAFLACSAYPQCKSTRPVSIGVHCPECQAPLSERRSKQGKVFFGCTAYPKCKFASWDKPVPQTCPQCQSKYLLAKTSKKTGEKLKCPNKDCGFEKALG